MTNTIETAAQQTATAQQALVEAVAELNAAKAKRDGNDTPATKKAWTEAIAEVEWRKAKLSDAVEAETAARKAASDASRATAEIRFNELAAALAPAGILARFAPSIERLRRARRELIAVQAEADRLVSEQYPQLAETAALAAEHGFDLTAACRERGIYCAVDGSAQGITSGWLTTETQRALSADRAKDGHEHGPLVRWLSTHHHV